MYDGNNTTVRFFLNGMPFGETVSFSNARAFLPKDKTSIFVGRNLSAWIDNFKVYSEDLSSDISVASNLGGVILSLFVMMPKELLLPFMMTLLKIALTLITTTT